MIFLIGLSWAALFAAPLRADYVITGVDGKTARAQAYWIQDGKLFSPENPTGIDVYSVRAITPENLTEVEARQQDEAVELFRSRMAELLEQEKGLASFQEDILKKISQFPVGKKDAVEPEDREALVAGLEPRKEETRKLMEAWRQVRLPDFSLLRMRDIKILELLSLDASMDQTLRYLRTGDPTYFELAKAHMSQHASFEDSFREAVPWK